MFHESSRWGVLVPLGTIFATGLLNLAYLLPETNKITALRRQQGKIYNENYWVELLLMQRNRIEKKDGKASYDPAPHSKEMTALNKQFGKIHGISSLANLVTLLATVVYGIHLSTRLE